MADEPEEYMDLPSAIKDTQRAVDLLQLKCDPDENCAECDKFSKCIHGIHMAIGDAFWYINQIVRILEVFYRNVGVVTDVTSEILDGIKKSEIRKNEPPSERYIT